MHKPLSLEIGDCSNCSQKDTLLHKYEHLLKLYKKKELKTGEKSDSQITRPITSQDLTLNDPKAVELCDILKTLVKRRQASLFRMH